MKKNCASKLLAFAAVSVALLAGCITTDANFERTTVQAKGSIYIKPKQKPGPKKTRRKKRETRHTRAAASGYVRTAGKAPADTGKVHFVCVPRCYVRQTPNTKSRPVAELLKNDWVRVLKTKSSWCLVETGAGSVGWVSQNLIK